MIMKTSNQYINSIFNINFNWIDVPVLDNYWDMHGVHVVNKVARHLENNLNKPLSCQTWTSNFAHGTCTQVHIYLLYTIQGVM